MLHAKLVAFLGLSLLLALSGPAKAQESPLAQVPADAPIVVQIHGLERTKGRLAAMIKAMLPDLAPIAAAKIDEAMKEGLEGREVKSLTPDGPIFIAFVHLPRPGEPAPPVAVIARVTSYASFRDGILKEDERKSIRREGGYELATVEGQELYFLERPGYAVITPRKDVAQALVRGGPGLDGKLGAETTRRFLEPDLAAYVNMAAVNKEYGAAIQQGRQVLQLLVQQADVGNTEKQFVEMAKVAVDAVFQLIDDSRLFLFSMELGPEGFGLRTEVHVAADSKTNGYFKASSPGAMKELSALPAGMMVYSGTEVDGQIWKSLQSMNEGITGDGEAGKEIDKLYQTLAEAGWKNMVQGAALQGRGLTVQHYSDPGKASRTYLRLFELMKSTGNYHFMPVKKVEVKGDAESFRGYQLHYAAVDWDLEKALAGQPVGKEMAEALTKLVGDSVRIWFGTDGKTFVMVQASSWDQAKGYLTEYLEGKTAVGQEREFQAARRHLPAEANLMGLMNSAMYAQAIGDYLSATFKAMGLGANLAPPAKVQAGEAPYLGMAVTLQPGRLAFDLWIPSGAVGEFRKVVEPMIRGLRGELQE